MLSSFLRSALNQFLLFFLITLYVNSDTHPNLLTLQIFEDPSNFFILDLAGPSSDSIGIPITVQVLLHQNVHANIDCGVHCCSLK